MPMMPMTWGIGWFMMLLMIVGAVLAVIVLGLLIWALTRWLRAAPIRPAAPHLGGNLGGDGRGANPLDVLRERYARGEIDTDTFEDMRRRLEATRSSDRTSTTIA